MPTEGIQRPLLPEGTVTLLLGDVEGSVGWWEADPGAMGLASRRLHEIVSRAAREHEGVRPVEQGEGDSFVLAFARGSDAIAGAIDVQRTIRRESWPGDIELRVRVGIHTGEVEVRDGLFYEGSTINRCARLRDLGHGGQTLVSRATRDVVADRLPDGAMLEDLGRHGLRGFDGAEQVYALRHPELLEAFPPLRGGGGVGGGMPLQLTSFVGREQERQDVRGLLSRARLITLTGAGGSGKTRLAIEVVGDVAGEFDAGAWWIDLAPLSEPALLASTVAAVLGIRESSSEDVVDTLVGGLADHRLVVLDNCEHLVEECAGLVARLLAACPEVVVVATSREPLRVDGEVTFRVPSLEVPDDEPATIAALSASPAARLFLDRAALARPDVRPPDRDAAAIAGICRRLDGIPLAIELAAGRTRLLTPSQILEDLADRFHLLTGGARTAMPRQQTLEASIDWSYQLLEEPERALLARLSVFAGSFDLAAVTEVCASGPIGPTDVLDLLSHLVDRSLVQVEDAGGRARYRLLETLREYARLRLADANEVAEFRTRHLDHYAALAEAAAGHLRSDESRAWLARLDDELGNLRAAMDWALASGQPDKQLRISGALLSYWMLRSLYAEVRLRMMAGLEASAGDPKVRGRALSTAALVSVMAGNYRAAQALAREGVDLGRQLDDIRGLQQCLMYLGWSELWLGDHGLEHLEEALRLAEELDDALLRRLSWFYLAVIRHKLLRLADADAWFDRAFAAAEAAGDRYTQGVTAFFHGLAHCHDGHLDDAGRLLDRAIALNKGIGNETFLAFSLAALAYTRALLGRYDKASAGISEAHTLAQRLSDHAEVFTDSIEGAIRVVTGQVEGTEMAAGAGERFRAMGALYGVAWCMRWVAEAALLRRDLAAARPAVEEALAISQQGGFRYIAANALRLAGRLALLDGDPVDAAERLHEALAIVRDRDNPLGTVQVLESLAEVAASDEDYTRAVRLLATAEVESARHGFAHIPRYAHVLDAVLERARATLGDEGFDAAWAEGTGLSLEESVAYARRGRGERRRPDTGWDSLTPTELDVVRRVAEGLSNPQIAQRLFVSRNTVKTHLSSIYSKLAIASRAQLASEATRRGLSPTPNAQDHPAG